MDDKEKLINRILEDIRDYAELFELEERLGFDEGWDDRLERLTDKLRKCQFDELLTIYKGE